MRGPCSAGDLVTGGFSQIKAPVARPPAVHMAVVLAMVCAATSLAQTTIERAEALRQAHDYDNAKVVFEALLKANPKNADYRARYGEMFYERFNPADAQKLYEEALGIDPKNPRALM